MPRRRSSPPIHRIKAVLEFFEVTEDQLTAATGFPRSYVLRANRGLAEITPGYARACSDFFWLRPGSLFELSADVERELADFQATPWRYWLNRWQTTDVDVEPER